LQNRPDVELQIVACASAVVTRFGRVADQILKDGFAIAETVDSVLDEDTLGNSAKSTGLLMLQLAGTFERLRPDVVVTIADRHETLATAIAASYQHIPLCHIQGGEVTGSIDDKVRNAVTQLADVHCVATEGARTNLYGMLPEHVPDNVHVTGCPSIDLAAEALRHGPSTLADVIVLQHPVTDQVEQAGEQMRATIEAVGKDALYFWPGEDAGGSLMSKELRLAGINPVRNMAPLDFLRALLGCKVLVGNSSVGIRECSFLGVPNVSVGWRQNGRESGPNTMRVCHAAWDIRDGIEQALDMHPRPSTLYGDGHAGERIAGILAGAELRRVA
jgi:UDP-hydrolysing UDP-N-acetyl-D-glucosamine 2-epimerase